jgi:hypothetical protein
MNLHLLMAEARRKLHAGKPMQAVDDIDRAMPWNAVSDDEDDDPTDETMPRCLP